MRAVVVEEPGSPETMKISEVDIPIPGPGEILVKTVAAGVNRADLLQRQGYYPPPKGVTEIMGLEASGIVAKLGQGVTGLNIGDKVVALLAGGGYAEYFTVPASNVVPQAAGMDLITAAGLIEVSATVLSNLNTVNLSPGESFLVHGGAGGIGNFAIQYAKLLGCRVFTTAGDPTKLDFCHKIGADFALDYHQDWVSQLKQLTDGKGVDVILDIIGAKYLEYNVKSLANHGRLVVIGLQGGVKGTLNLGLLLNKWATITASNLRFRSTTEKADICRKVTEDIWPLVSSGKIKPAPETRIPFEQVTEAHRQLESGKNIGKIILTF